jgi:hypothetical protein
MRAIMAGALTEDVCQAWLRQCQANVDRLRVEDAP